MDMFSQNIFSTILLQQYYDWDAKVVRTKYVPWFIFGEENKYEYTTELIQDFQQGQRSRVVHQIN